MARNRSTAPQNKSTSSDSDQAPPVGSQPPPELATNQLAEKLATGQLDSLEQISLGRLLQEADPQQGDRLQLTRVTSETRFSSGPLPAPEVLSAYDPETKRFILDMADKEQAHSHAMQKDGMEGHIQKDKRGQCIGGVIAVSALLAAAYISQHSPLAAAVIGVLDLVSLVAVFAAPRVLEHLAERKRERKE